jgi:hypothetical protein
MRYCLLMLPLLCLLSTGLAGCAQHPLTDTEFRGFCYTHVERRASCDTLGLCNEFDNTVLSVPQASRAACSQACATVYNRLYGPNQFEGCAPTVLYAYNMCVRYCNTNYAQ